VIQRQAYVVGTCHITFQHLTVCLSFTLYRSISSSLHLVSTTGHLPWNLQPGGGLKGLGKLLYWCVLHDVAHVHHSNHITYVTYHIKVMGDKEIAKT